MQRPQLQDKLNIASTKHRISPKCLAHTRKLWRLQQPFFLAVFRLADFFSGAFSANAENVRLGG